MRLLLVLTLNNKKGFPTDDIYILLKDYELYYINQLIILPRLNLNLYASTIKMVMYV